MDTPPNAVTRRSSVCLPGEPDRTVRRQGWEVVRSYREEGRGPLLIDLSHRAKWDVQHAALTDARPWGLIFPDAPGSCRLDSGWLLGRMTTTQALIWSLAAAEPPPAPEPCMTEITDGVSLLPLLGAPVFSLLERVTDLDLTDPGREVPRLVLGPVLHVPSQVVVLDAEGDRPVVLLACCRGYGASLARALLDEGKTWGFRPGGEGAFEAAMAAASPSAGAGPSGKPVPAETLHSEEE